MVPGLRTVLGYGQGAYFALTGLWSLVSIETFMLVTGHKTDVWLVKTVGVLVLVVGTTLLLATYREALTPEVRFLAIGSALVLAAIEIWYVANDTISPIYLLDAILELVLVALWLVPTREASSATSKKPTIQTDRIGP